MSVRGNGWVGVIIPKLLVLYLSFILYLYLASWLAYLNLAYLPFWSLPPGSLLPLVLLGIVAVTLHNSWRKRRKKAEDKTAV